MKKIKSESYVKVSGEEIKGENPCWDGYGMVGHKKKDGKEVPNCVPKDNKKD